MNSSPTSHRALKVLLGTLAAALVLLGLVFTAVALLDGDQLRGPLVRYLTAHTGRPWRIDGPIEAHLVSLHPSLIAGQVTIANPPWAPAGNTAEGSFHLVRRFTHSDTGSGNSGNTGAG